MSNVLKIVDSTKICSICGVDKHTSLFTANRGKHLGVTSDCKDCRNKKRQKSRAIAKQHRLASFVPKAPPTHRSCLACGETKPLDAFSRDKTGTYGRTSQCKPCRNSNKYVDPRKGDYKSRPERVLRAYGVTYEEVAAAYAAQHGLCANRGCGCAISLEGSMGRNRAVIDHDHTAGKFRAILCMQCNIELGKVEADKNKFLGLLEYLDKFTN